MPESIERGPFCQSCGMPMHQPADFGTTNDGIHVNDYCRFCWVDGAFTNPMISMPEMLDFCTRELTRQGMAEARARALMRDTLPRLKRWGPPALV